VITLFKAFTWWVQPRVKGSAIEDALLPFVFLHGFSHPGLILRAMEQFYAGFPIGLLPTVGPATC
jgi:hypothetical protein